jgi:hypothetical protein
MHKQETEGWLNGSGNFKKYRKIDIENKNQITSSRNLETILTLQVVWVTLTVNSALKNKKHLYLKITSTSHYLYTRHVLTTLDYLPLIY